MDYSDRLQAAMKAARNGAGIDRQTLADALGISVAAVGLVINRKSKMLDAANHCRAARACGVDPYWLATGEGEMTPAAAWPFGADIHPAHIQQLKPAVVGQLVGYIAGKLEQHLGIPAEQLSKAPQLHTGMIDFVESQVMARGLSGKRAAGGHT